jgi:prepilin-type N-terminal cleavage/methylation domain-containing protein
MISRSNPRGFTLIETIVVVVILGLMLSIATGFLPRRHERLELAMAASRVAGTLRLARAHAIAGDRPVLVRLDGARHALLVDGNAQALPGGLALALEAPGGTIRFATDGSASGGTIRLNGATLRTVVGVDWLTGRVVVSDVR